MQIGSPLSTLFCISMRRAKADFNVDKLEMTKKKEIKTFTSNNKNKFISIVYLRN